LDLGELQDARGRRQEAGGKKGGERIDLRRWRVWVYNWQMADGR
jgi:hypothetical protein